MFRRATEACPWASSPELRKSPRPCVLTFRKHMADISSSQAGCEQETRVAMCATQKGKRKEGNPNWPHG